MTTESLVTLFWYGLVGWSTAELHRHIGIFSRYSGFKYWLGWVVMFFCWPMTLPLCVNYIGEVGKRSGDDE